MKTTTDTKIEIRTNLKELGMLKKISIMLTQERDFDKLFGYVLDAAMEYSNAEGATIYMVDDEAKQLRFIKVFNSAMKVSLNVDQIDWPPIPLFYDEEPNLKNIATLCYHHKRSYNIADVYEQQVFDNSGTLKYDKLNKYRTKSIVAIPMMDHKNRIIGVIQLVNALNDNGDKIAFIAEEIGNLEVLASFSAILMNNQMLIKDIQTSFHQFISSIAWAIDKKSKHFSGHIARVSELVDLFAREINEYQEGKSRFADINFTEDELEEINIAGLMHDLGKIITPMHILDKGSKLQQIADRIELVLERIDHIRSIVQMEIDHAEVESKIELEKIQQRIDQFEKFLVKANSGRSYFSDNDIQALEEIYQFRYMINGKSHFIINDDEYFNLKIRMGTLNPEDIRIIREHVVVTGDMLAQIKFPAYLSNAPLYAKLHHEKLNGEGYPDGLTEHYIPLQARILALSDVFEALTATRPYKKSKKLSETYIILDKMVAANEIDQDLYLFALEQGIFKKYADKHLTKDQIDR
ncbi:MAG: HD domain-containing phosphohydrolase [Candidatus Stygibacter frigidus]|nr:HD domain-containing phosphohydrolase [Candidatus Stygibacter frigidus]